MRFAIIAVTLLSLFFCSSALIIDDFDATDPLPGLICAVPDVISVGGVPTYPEAVCFTQLHSTNVIGGEADLIIKNLVHTGGGTQSTICTFENNILGWSVPPSVPAVMEVHWDGANNFDAANPYAIVYNGLGGLDLTDDGSAQGILFRTTSSDLAVPLTFTFYTSANEVSQFRIDQSAILAGRNTTFLAIPFANFGQAPFASSPADFTNIGAVTFGIDTPPGGTAPSVDVSVTTISTVNLLTTTKTDEVLASVDMVANPGEIIKYTIDITNEVDLLGLDLNGTYLFDNPSALTPYLTLVSGTVAVTTVNDVGVTIPNPATLQIFTGNTAGDKTIAIFFGTLKDGYHYFTTFNVTVGNMPCVHPTCAYPQEPTMGQGCQVAGQDALGGGRCLCTRNQGAACFNIPANADFNSLPPLFVNFNDSLVRQNCKRTNDPATVTQPGDATRTPVWALPDPAITKTLVDGSQSAGVAPGSSVAWKLDITNNFRRQSSEVQLCDEVPAGTKFTTTGSSAGWLDQNLANPCDATSSKCCMNIGALAAMGTASFTFAVAVDASLPCATSSLTSKATITTSGTDCPETNLNNNEASITVPITGGVDLAITKTAAPSPATIGTDATIVYTITYVNTGVRDAEGAVITESVPAGYTFNAAGSSAQWVAGSGNTYTATIGTVARNVPNSLTFAINLPAYIDCPVTDVVNTVSIKENCGDINMANNDATATVVLNAVPNLALTMTRVGDFTPGATVCYTLSYSNIGTRVATASTITNNVPANTVFATTGSSTFSCAAGAAAGTACTLTVGDVIPGASADATFCVTADSNLPCGSGVINNAAIATTCNEVDMSNNAATNTAPVNGSPSLTLTKTASAATIALGDVVVYTLAYSNVGSIEASAVTLTETLPSGTTFAAASSTSGWTASGASYTLSVPNLAPGATGSATFAVTLNGPTFIGCTIAAIPNTASIVESCGGAAAVTASASIQPTATADLYVNANDSAPVVLKNTQTATVPLVFGNLGVMSGRNVVITATVPNYAAGVPDSNFVLEGGNLVNKRDSVAGLTGNQPLSLVYTITRPLPCGVDSLPVTITITTDCNEVTTTNNAVTVNIPIIVLPDMVVTKDDNVDEPVRVGGQIDYTITYWNAGYRHATNVVLTESYDVNVTPLNSAGWTCDTVTRNCTFSHGAADVVVGEGPFTTTFSVTVGENLSSQTIIHNHVEVTNDCGEDYAPDNEDVEDTPVVGNPDLVVHKTDNGFEARPGDIITYTITYENIGDSAAPDTVISELVPVFSKFVAALSTPGWDCADGSGAGTPCRMSVGTVNRGATPAPLIFAVKTNEWLRCGIDTIDNCVNIKTTNDTIELLYTNNRDTEETPIIACPNLIVTVTDNLNDRARHSRLRVGERVIYNISYTNCGNREGVNAQLIESVPAWTTFSEENSTAGWNCSTGAPAGTVCVMNLGDLVPGTEGWVTFAVNVAEFPVEVKSTRDEVCIVNDCGECDPTNNCDHDFTPLFGVPDLKIDETAECRSIEWYVEWTNVGDQTANNVVVTDTLPAGTTYVPEQSDAWTCTGASCTYDVGDVRPGKGGHLILTTNPLNGTSGVFTNVVEITGTGRPGVPDPTPENNIDSAVVGFDGCPISCDSCCPEEEACCPDKTEVVFNFGGILDGVSQCQAEP